ncbi:hypothetical protein [Micromonospora sp. HM134]|uniref:hypothetical protein n=1 Tax=Micromonospora sp. HM134 TaxID=2583243 RepID=UPI00143D556C|nr:hypothetical protein [Micromonospora sp. HM134]
MAEHHEVQRVEQHVLPGELVRAGELLYVGEGVPVAGDDLPGLWVRLYRFVAGNGRGGVVQGYLVTLDRVRALDGVGYQGASELTCPAVRLGDLVTQVVSHGVQFAEDAPVVTGESGCPVQVPLVARIGPGTRLRCRI